MKGKKENTSLIVFQPQPIEHWDYNESVKKVKTYFLKWKDLTQDILNELAEARERLSNPGARTDLVANATRYTWASYCEAIGVDRSTVHRWITIWEGKKLRQDKQRKLAQLSGQYDVEIRHGDFQDVFADIDNQSVNCILTDPPYGKDFLPVWDSLGKFSARVLQKDGLLITYSGQMYLPEIISSLQNHLDWWWLCGVVHKGTGNLTPLGQPVRKVINEFKPVLIFIPKDGEGPGEVFHDLIEGTGPEKDMHNWQQPISEAKLLLETFCEPDDLIIDPFAGSGGFGEAAKQLGMRFIGAEILDERLKETT